MTMRRLTRKNFSEWLSRFDDGVVVGYTRMPFSCPVSNYFSEVYGVTADTEESEIRFINSRNQDVTIDNPKWAQRFINYVDDIMVDGNRMDIPVTAGEARRLFNLAVNCDKEFVI